MFTVGQRVSNNFQWRFLPTTILPLPPTNILSNKGKLCFHLKPTQHELDWNLTDFSTFNRFRLLTLSQDFMLELDEDWKNLKAICYRLEIREWWSFDIDSQLSKLRFIIKTFSLSVVIHFWLAYHFTIKVLDWSPVKVSISENRWEHWNSKTLVRFDYTLISVSASACLDL